MTLCAGNRRAPASSAGRRGEKGIVRSKAFLLREQKDEAVRPVGKFSQDVELTTLRRAVCHVTLSFLFLFSFAG